MILMKRQTIRNEEISNNRYPTTNSSCFVVRIFNNSIMNFKVGDKVVCVEKNQLARVNSRRATKIILDKEYTIKKPPFSFHGLIYVTLEDTGDVSYWYVSSFRKAEPNKSVSKKLVEELKDNPEWIKTVPEKIEEMEKLFTTEAEF